MNILICNVGSTSLKYQVFDMDAGEAVLASGKAERVGSKMSLFAWRKGGSGAYQTAELPLPSHREAIEFMLTKLPEAGLAVSDVACVGFKVVQAKDITGVQLLTEEVLEAMAEYNHILPAHNPPYIAAIRQFKALLPGVPLVGSFETGFHRHLKPEVYLYSLPTELSKAGIRRYGAHGASHEYVSGWVAEKIGRDDLKIVTCHLGGSGSLAAVNAGVSVDTTLGFSLQSGIMHNNRCGDIDPYIVIYLMETLGMSLTEVKTLLQTKSGFYGMSGGVSGDLRDIEEAAKNGNQDAENAIRSYAYQIKKLIGSYAAVMGGLDCVAFAGGIGENSATVRALACVGMEALFGLSLDQEKNRLGAPGSDISAEGSKVRVFIVATNEEIVVARKAAALLGG